jgi:DSF synthase
LIVAERSTTMSFPEVLFNLFAGMGALSFLSRKIGMRKAEEIVTSGQIFTAKQMQELGVVDELVEDGLGLETTHRMIRARRRKQNTHRAIRMAKQIVEPVHRDELQAIVNIWVDSAMQLETRDLRMMARLVRAQDKLISTSQEDCVIESLFEQPPLLAVGNG